jgi:hypothetical protein
LRAKSYLALKSCVVLRLRLSRHMNSHNLE